VPSFTFIEAEASCNTQKINVGQEFKELGNESGRSGKIQGRQKLGDGRYENRRSVSWVLWLYFFYFVTLVGFDHDDFAASTAFSEGGGAHTVPKPSVSPRTWLRTLRE
jgi:hypothetical protein